MTSRRRMLYHLAEGSEIFPLDWLMALKSVKTGKPFLEDPERFGLIQDPEILEIPGHEGVRLPIGLTIGTPPDVLGAIAAIKRSPGPPDPLAMPHGRCELRGLPCRPAPLQRTRTSRSSRAPRILFNIDSFYQELFQSAAETVLKPRQTRDIPERPGETGSKERNLEDPGDDFRPDQEESRPASVESAIKRIREL